MYRSSETYGILLTLDLSIKSQLLSGDRSPDGCSLLMHTMSFHYSEQWSWIFGSGPQLYGLVVLSYLADLESLHQMLSILSIHGIIYSFRWVGIISIYSISCLKISDIQLIYFSFSVARFLIDPTFLFLK